MRLIGMLDSPYVRRVAISMKLMDSTLILDHLEGLVPPQKRLMPLAGDARREALPAFESTPIA